MMRLVVLQVPSIADTDHGLDLTLLELLLNLIVNHFNLLHRSVCARLLPRFVTNQANSF